jgi:hypothetical protein
MKAGVVAFVLDLVGGICVATFNQMFLEPRRLLGAVCPACAGVAPFGA